MSSTKVVTILIIIMGIFSVSYQFRDFIEFDETWFREILSTFDMLGNEELTQEISVYQGPPTTRQLNESSSKRQQNGGAARDSGSEQMFQGSSPLKSFNLEDINRVVKVDDIKIAMNNRGSQLVKVANNRLTQRSSPTRKKITKHNIAIKPEFVQPFNKVKKGYNDSNPYWSPVGDILGFERSKLGKKEIILAHAEGKTLQVIYHKPEKSDDFDFLLPGITNNDSYNASISWSPNGKSYVFMSNAGKGNYDLYLGKLGSDKVERLTENAEKDGHPHWSPKGNKLVFVSGRSMNAQLYIFDFKTRGITKLTNHRKSFFYPQWSPDGKSIAVSYGNSYQHNIFLINNIKRTKKKYHFLTSWEYDDLRPVWSPNGKKIAFYSNYNTQDDPDIWSIVVINVNNRKGKLPRVDLNNIKHHIVATNVVADVVHGLAWLPNNQGILYVKKEEDDYNGIYYANLQTKSRHKLLTNTNINHDISCCSSDGIFAFRAQINQWDQIFIAKLATLGK